MKIAPADHTPEFNFLLKSIIFEDINSVHRKHGRLAAWMTRFCGASNATISDSPAPTRRAISLKQSEFISSKTGALGTISITSSLARNGGIRSWTWKIRISLKMSRFRSGAMRVDFPDISVLTWGLPVTIETRFYNTDSQIRSIGKRLTSTQVSFTYEQRLCRTKSLQSPRRLCQPNFSMSSSM